MRTSYRISFALHAHLVRIEARFTDAATLGDELDVTLAAWSPGSYLVRDYARHVLALDAVDEGGRSLAVAKTDKATWRVGRDGAREVVVRYELYAHELTVRTNHVDGTHAFLNGPSTFVFAPALASSPCVVELVLPDGWRVATALPGGPTRFTARDLDELLDSPLHAGAGPMLEAEAAGRPLRLAVWGRAEAGGAASLDTLLADTRNVVEVYSAIFGGVPYDAYTFLLMLAPGSFGGLEHRASSALLASPFAFSTRRAYEELLELVSHEYFHLWNVKRIRPRALGPFDYSRENYTRALWVMEGVTSYYDRHVLRRAGLVPIARYLEKLADEWGKLLAVPGRLRQSLEEASFDAWIKHYRPDEHTVNATVSYYLKGSVVALCLDLEIRRQSGGTRSLDDVMRHLFAEASAHEQGFDEPTFQREVELASGVSLGEFFDRFVRGREDPDLAGALAGVGLALRSGWEKPLPDGASAFTPPVWLGVTTRTDGGRVVVASVLAGGPAERGGLYPGDELVALGGWRVTPKGLAERLATHTVGDVAPLTVFRRDELVEVAVELWARPTDHFEIVPLESPGETACVLFAAWLGEAHPKAKSPAKPPAKSPAKSPEQAKG